MLRVVLLLSVTLSLGLGVGNVFGAGSGHDHQHQQQSPEGGAIIYSDEVSGMRALFVVDALNKIENKGKTLYECKIKVRISGAQGEASVSVADVALRYMSGHEKFGQVYALILDPDDDYYKKKLFLHESGEQHFLLIVIDEGGRKREFHFHHSF